MWDNGCSKFKQKVRSAAEAQSQQRVAGVKFHISYDEGKKELTGLTDKTMVVDFISRIKAKESMKKNYECMTKLHPSLFTYTTCGATGRQQSFLIVDI